MIVVDKAFAYITNQHRLLVFTHADFPAAGVQVPAGTIRPGERPEAAAAREAYEEAGLSELTEIAFLGTSQHDATPFGKAELHRRHFFHLPLVGPARERWRHYEHDASDGGHGPMAFDFFWLALAEAEACLIAGHGTLIDVVRTRL